MIEDLMKDFVDSDYHKTTIVQAIERAVGRPLVVGKDYVFIDFGERTHNKTGEQFQYGAVVFEGTVYGFLDIDWGEPCLRFTPAPALLPLK